MAQAERSQSRPRRPGMFGAFPMSSVLCRAEGIFLKEGGISVVGTGGWGVGIGLFSLEGKKIAVSLRGEGQLG